jgi:hypothetical protein
MNININITDIYGCNLSDNNSKKSEFNKDYIIIDFSYDDIDKILIPINQYNGTFIYKLNKTAKFFNKIKNILNIDEYCELGNYMIYDMNNIKILLVHNKACIKTNKYTLLDVIGQLYIWKPIIIDNEYTNLGVVCTDNNYDLPTDYIGLIPSEYVKINNNTNNSDIFSIDYNILSSNRNGRKKLLTMNILKYDKENDKENDSTNIEYFSNINENVYNNSSEKHLVLVDSDDPWYINKNDNIELKYISNENYFGVKNKYLEGAKFKTNIKLNASDPILGYGYSYADRKNVIIEKFSNNKDKSNYIILLIFGIIIILFIYNIYLKKYKK